MLCKLCSHLAVRSGAQDAVKSGKNTFLGVPDTTIKIPAVGLSFLVDRLVRNSVQMALAAERRRATGGAARAQAAPLAKVLDAPPQRAAAMMEE